jgi:hypothetical protein
MTVVALSNIDRIRKLFIEAVSKSIFKYLRNCNKNLKKIYDPKKVLVYFIAIK